MLTKKGFVDVRWYDRRALAALEHVHRICFPTEGWTKADFREFANKSGQIVKAVFMDEEIIGSFLYRMSADEVRIARIAILPEFQRQGIGSHVVRTLVGPQSPNRRRVYTARVREHNLAAQLFFTRKILGFSCVETDRGFYEDGSDAYWFRFTRPDLSRRRREAVEAAKLVP